MGGWAILVGEIPDDWPTDKRHPWPMTATSAPTKNVRLLRALVAGLLTHWVAAFVFSYVGVAVSPLVVLAPLAVGALVHDQWPLVWQRLVLPLAAGLFAMQALTVFAYGASPFLFLAVGLAALGATVQKQRKHSLTVSWVQRCSS